MVQGYGEEPPTNDQHRVSDVRSAARDDQVNDEQKAASAADDQQSTNLSRTYFGHVCSENAAVVLAFAEEGLRTGYRNCDRHVTHLRPEGLPTRGRVTLEHSAAELEHILRA